MNPAPVVGLLGRGAAAAACEAAIATLPPSSVRRLVRGAPGAVLQWADVVVVAAALDEREALIEQALRAGRPVLALLPVAASAAGARRLAALAAEVGVPLAQVRPARRAPEALLLHDAVHGGDLGRLAVLRLVGSAPAPLDADADAMDGEAADVVEHALVHDLDLAGWVAGDVVRASAVRRRTPAVDAVHALLTHDSGAITQCSALLGPAHLPAVREYSATGDAGDLSHASRGEVPMVAALADGGLTVGPDDLLSAELQHVLAAVTGASPTRPTEDGAAVAGLVQAVLASLELGGPVETGGSGS